MAASFITAGTLATNATTVTLPVVAPALLAGDIMVACLINKALANVITPQDASWSLIVQDGTDCVTAADDHRFAVYWKRAVAGDSQATFNFTKATDDNQLFAGVIAIFRGCPTTGTPLDPTPVGVFKTTAVSDNVQFPAFDPGGTDAHIVYIAFYGNDATTFAAAMSSDVNPDCTKRFDLETNAGSDCTIACISGDTTNGASINARTWASVASVDAGSTGVVFGLRTATANPVKTTTTGGGALTGNQGALAESAVCLPPTGALAADGQLVEVRLSVQAIVPPPGVLFLSQQTGLIPGTGALASVGQPCVVQPIAPHTGSLALVGGTPSSFVPLAAPLVGALSLDGVAGTVRVDTPRTPLEAEVWFGIDDVQGIEVYALPATGALVATGAAVTRYPNDQTPDLGALALTGEFALAVTGTRLTPASMVEEPV